MDALPLIPHVLGLILVCAAGMLNARRIRRVRPDIDAENGIKHLPHVWVLAGVGLIVTVAVYWLITRPIGVQAQYPLGLLDAAPVALWGTVLLVFGYVFSLTIGLAFATRHETRWALVVGAVLAVVAVEIAHAKSTTPIWSELEVKVSADGAIMQSSGSTCAAASGANVAAALGLVYTEIDVARHMGSTNLGTSTGQIVRGMAALGIACTPFSLDPTRPAAIPAPAIVFVPLSDGFEDGHAIAILDVTPERIVLVDPLLGRRERTPAELVGHWGGRGVHCTRSSPTAD